MKKRTLLKTLMAAVLVCATATLAGEVTTVKGNPESKVYHKPDCRYYGAKSTTVVFKTEAEAQKAGYTACKRCGKAKAEKAPKKAEPKKTEPKETDSPKNK